MYHAEQAERAEKTKEVQGFKGSSFSAASGPRGGIYIRLTHGVQDAALQPP